MTKHIHTIHTRIHALRIRRELLLGLVLIAVACIVIALSSGTPKPFASAEVQFADPSIGGLSIIPASCESNPPYEHSSGECDVAVSNNCTLFAGSGTIAPGQSTTLQWNVSQPGVAAFFPASFSGNISPGVGTVSTWTGSRSVSPTLTTTYVLNGTVAVAVPWFGSLRTGSTQCQTTVTVQALVCPTGSYAYNGTCVSGCPSGYYKYNGSCVQPCPTGYVAEEGACVFSACPDDYEQQGDQCVSTTPACSTLNYCVGTTLWHRDSQCSTNPIQACSNGCTAGGCIGIAPPGVALWQVHPLLVASGDTANVNWQVTSVRSCEVTGNNGDAWSGASGAQVSSPITAQTVFTLTCIGLDDSVVTRTGTVNIVPIFQEASAARAYAAAADAPFAQAAESDLRATIRAELLSDPRTSNLSQAQVDTLVDLLADEAEKQGITSRDIQWRPQSTERFVVSGSAAPQAPECAGGFLCTMTEAFGFVGSDATIPFTLGAASMGLVWILAEMIHRRRHPYVSTAPSV